MKLAIFCAITFAACITAASSYEREIALVAKDQLISP
jgi:hypothetical protein